MIGARVIYPLIKKDAPKLAPLKKPTISVPHLFVSDLEKCTTAEWEQRLLSSPDQYSSCKVVAITWVKALGSPVSHEFIQFVVEDSLSGERTRVHADRSRKSDNVYVGRDWNAEKNPSDQDDIPLPLYSLVFDDKDKQPSVISIAQILKEVTARDPTYSVVGKVWNGEILGHMCWWFANSVYETVKAKFGGVVEKWPWAHYAYQFIIWTTYWQRSSAEKAAEDFKQAQAIRMTRGGEELPGPQLITTEKYLEPIAQGLQDPEMQAAYQRALQIDETEVVDGNVLSKALANTNDNSDEASGVTSKNLMDATKAFNEVMLEDPEFDINVKAYLDALQERKREGQGVAGDVITGTEEAIDDIHAEEFEKAIKAFVGGVLRNLDGTPEA